MTNSPKQQAINVPDKQPEEERRVTEAAKFKHEERNGQKQ